MLGLLAEATRSANFAHDTDLVLLVARLVIGPTMSAHGLFKFFGGGKLPGTAGWFDSIGMRPGKLHAAMAATTETATGVMLAIGFLTPLAAAGFVGVMTVAAWTVNRPNGFFSAKHGYEYNLVLAVSGVLIACVSPGRYSLDWALGLDFSFNPRIAFLLSGVLGLAAAIGQIAIFFRPPPPKPAADS